jgi:aminotransferase EvaB
MPDSEIPFFSAAAANAGLDLLTPIRRVIDSHRYILGEEVAAFESEFAAYIGIPHCVSVANGTDALMLALSGVGVQAGDRVAVVANAGFYGSTALLALGAVPLFVEVDQGLLTMSPTALREALRAQPKAVIVTHLYGQLADIASLSALCAGAGVPLIEDCAQSHGARSGAKLAGSFGAVSCFSFYPTKNLGAIGDGGAVLTADLAIANRIRSLRQYGWSDKYKVALTGGTNSRLDELQAAVLRLKLTILDRQNVMRRSIAERYNDAFADLGIGCPPSVHEDYVAHLYVIQVDKRDAFRTRMKAQGVVTEIHYPIPDHRQPAVLADTCGVSLPLTERVCERVLSLPCFPGMTDEQIERVIAAVRRCVLD